MTKPPLHALAVRALDKSASTHDYLHMRNPVGDKDSSSWKAKKEKASEHGVAEVVPGGEGRWV